MREGGERRCERRLKVRDPGLEIRRTRFALLYPGHFLRVRFISTTNTTGENGARGKKGVRESVKRTGGRVC
jgi:hypothetical protein